VIERDPTLEDWGRLRYASWMRELCIRWEENISNDTLSRLLDNSPDGVLFPNLERLYWKVDAPYTPLSFFRLFLSPRLKRVNLHTRSTMFGLPWQLVPLAEVISCLPASLEHLSLMCGPWKGDLLKDVISSLVLRCGPLLRSFSSSTPLSEAALHHLMQLPNLRSWAVLGELP